MIDAWEDARSFFAPYHTLIAEELDFALKQRHYEDDRGNERDRRRVQPKDPSLINMIRHKTSQILKASTYFECHPIDDTGDPETALYAKSLIQRELDDPENEYEDVFEDVVVGALAARIWAAKLEYAPDIGPYGEIVVSSADPRTLFWTPGFRSPSNKRCPWVIEELSMSQEEFKAQRLAGWKHLDEVMPDASPMYRTTTTTGAGGEIRNIPTSGTGPSNQPIYTVLRCWKRFDYSTTKRRVEGRVLAPDERYMRCFDCGHMGDPQGPGEALPEYGSLERPEYMCPNCAVPMQRVDSEDIEKEVLSYRKGKRLIVVSPSSGKTLFDDSWPYDMRGFPVVIYKAYWHPIEPIPESDTSYYWTLVLLMDSMYRMGYEQMSKSHGIILAPEDGLVDAVGEPWQFSDYKDVAYYTDAITPNSVQFFQPAGLNPAWSTYLQAVQGAFAANKGTGDISLTPERSRDIAAATIRTMVQTGEIPVDHHIRRFQRFKSILLTRLYEIKRSTCTSAEAVRVSGPDGAMIVKRIRASGLPGFDVIVTAEPQVTEERMAMLEKASKLAGLPPALRRFAAKVAGVPMKLVQELEADEMAARQAQPQPGPPGVPPSNGGPPMAPAEMSMMMGG